MPAPSATSTSTTLPRSSDEHLVEPVEIKVSRGRRHLAAGHGKILCGDELGQCGHAHVHDVDAAKEAVPVAVVGLGAIEVVLRQIAGRPGGHRLHHR